MRTRRTLLREIDLSFAQRLELRLGPGHESAFASDSDRYRAWLEYRVELMADPGRLTPWAFWEYDGPPECRRPDDWDGEDWEALGAARDVVARSLGR